MNPINQTANNVQVPVNNAVQNQPVNQQPQVNNGQSTISSAASSQGCGASIYDCISNLFNAVINCLSNLPLIGTFFVTDAKRLQTIKNLCATNAASDTAVANALVEFGQMGPKKQLEGLIALQESNDVPHAVFLKFYEALPEDSKNMLRTAVYKANGNSSVIQGHDHLLGVGEKVIYDMPRDNLMKLAMTDVKNQISKAV